MKKIALCGSTGSIGIQALEVVRHQPDIAIEVLVAYGSKVDLLLVQIQEFNVPIVVVYLEEAYKQLKKTCPNTKIFLGEEAIQEAVSLPQIDFVLMAITGFAALKPSFAAISAGKNIGLASKEVLVVAGELMMTLAHHKKVTIIPVDSEHSALFQCLNGVKKKDVRRLILTASGGPFFKMPQKDLKNISISEVLNHPTWKMGAKVTVDSSTLVNKGLELMEACWLFGINPEKIEAIIHPESIIHSLIETIDGTLLAQMNKPSMINPIQYALTWPERKKSILPYFDFNEYCRMEFFPLDQKRHRAFFLAKEVLLSGKSYPCFFNAANEVLVQRFLKGEIEWLYLVDKLEKLLSTHMPIEVNNIEGLDDIDQEARQKALFV